MAARLIAWDDAFQATLNPDDPTASRFPDNEAQAIWQAEGAALLHALRTHLGTDAVTARLF